MIYYPQTNIFYSMRKPKSPNKSKLTFQFHHAAIREHIEKCMVKSIYSS